MAVGGRRYRGEYEEKEADDDRLAYLARSCPDVGGQIVMLGLTAREPQPFGKRTRLIGRHCRAERLFARPRMRLDHKRRWRPGQARVSEGCVPAR